MVWPIWNGKKATTNSWHFHLLYCTPLTNADPCLQYCTVDLSDPTNQGPHFFMPSQVLRTNAFTTTSLEAPDRDQGIKRRGNHPDQRRNKPSSALRGGITMHLITTTLLERANGANTSQSDPHHGIEGTAMVVFGFAAFEAQSRGFIFFKCWVG